MYLHEKEKIDLLLKERGLEHLKSNNIDYIEDMLSLYTDIFIIEYSEFVHKFEILKKKFDSNFCTNLAFKLNILESMWEI